MEATNMIYFMESDWLSLCFRNSNVALSMNHSKGKKLFMIIICYYLYIYLSFFPQPPSEGCLALARPKNSSLKSKLKYLMDIENSSSCFMFTVYYLAQFHARKTDPVTESMFWAQF